MRRTAPFEVAGQADRSAGAADRAGNVRASRGDRQDWSRAPTQPARGGSWRRDRLRPGCRSRAYRDGFYGVSRRHEATARRRARGKRNQHWGRTSNGTAIRRSGDRRGPRRLRRGDPLRAARAEDRVHREVARRGDGKPVLGGTCLNVGCIPSKALLDSYAQVRTRRATASRCTASSASELTHGPRGDAEAQAQIVRRLTGGIAGLFKANGVTALARQRPAAGRATRSSSRPPKARPR